MLECMIWDVDGTLVDSEELHRASFNRVFEEYGLDWYWNQKTYCDLLEVAGGKERICHYSHMVGTGDDSLPAPIQEIHARKTEIYHEGIQSGHLQLRDGVEALLNEALENGTRLAIATTTSFSNVEALFAADVLQPAHWEVVVAGDHVEKKKPAPDVYREALKQLELEPMDCLAVEDSEIGLLSAHLTGIPTVITPNKYTRSQNFNKAIAVVDDLKEDFGYLGFGYMEAWHAAAVALSA